MNNKPKIVLRHRSGNCHYYDSWKDFYSHFSRYWVSENVTSNEWVGQPKWSDYENTEYAWHHYNRALREYYRKWVVEGPKGKAYTKDHVLAQDIYERPRRRRSWRRSKVGRRFEYPKVMPTRRSDIGLVELEEEYRMHIGRNGAPYPDPWDDTYERLQRSWKVHRKQQWKGQK